MIYKNPERGNVKGKCVFCTETTEYGFKKVFSGNFTGYNRLFEGNCICEYCNAFFREQKYRKSNFIVTKDNVNFLKRVEILENLLNLPNPPFFIYLTFTYQKQGWLGNFDRISYSGKRFYICTEKNVIYVEIEKLIGYIEFAKELREYKIPKKDMLSELSVNSLKKLEEAGKRDLKEKLEEIDNKNLWEVIVYGIE